MGQGRAFARRDDRVEGRPLRAELSHPVVDFRRYVRFLRPPRPDAETAPLESPEAYQFDLDLPAIAEVWRRGSVIRSWLLDLSAQALLADPDLSGFGGAVSDSGEGRWTLKAAIDTGAPAPVISAALYQRFASRGEDNFAARLLSAMRREFGGHAETSHREK